MPRDEPKEVKIRGVRKAGWMKIASIVMVSLTVALMLFFIANNHFGWIEVLP